MRKMSPQKDDFDAKVSRPPYRNDDVWCPCQNQSDRRTPEHGH